MAVTQDQNSNALGLDQSGPYPSSDTLVRLRSVGRDLQLFAPRTPSTSEQAGNLRTRYKGRGMDFAEVRGYQAGDDVRTIDWRVTAKTGETHTKLYTEERERPVLLLVDLRSPMFFGSKRAFKSVTACHVAASLAWAGLQHGDRVGALVFGDHGLETVRPKRSHHAVLALINEMVRVAGALDSPVAAADAPRLSTLLEEARRIARPGSAIMLASDCHDLDEDCEHPLYLLQRHADVQILRILDPLDRALPRDSITLSDGNKRCFADKHDTQLRNAFENSQLAVRQTTDRLCRQFGLPLIDIDNTQPVVQQLRQVYRAKQTRRPVGVSA
ncbi:DUF58 domain-containing protein [Biformimicrobium ophioploci]|uniref:DUF58 domain-containing protein n=1 Tax=Biformimicrobium ophioploci TaxID=3036711 RepID=A0ABQ6M1T3_9GAMM|nr:DUF58 domain-containing protein [Microbulbifer sp. NKW57]GMG88314.1 DUF58 domain-containing protein [Microbulbifer sp. NKW57]